MVNGKLNMIRYRVFHRTWWKEGDPEQWPDGLEPEMGLKFDIGYAYSISEAQAMCEAWSKKNDPGRYADRAEFEEA
jgi:hypothetical protein